MKRTDFCPKGKLLEVLQLPVSTGLICPALCETNKKCWYAHSGNGVCKLFEEDQPEGYTTTAVPAEYTAAWMQTYEDQAPEQNPPVNHPSYPLGRVGLVTNKYPVSWESGWATGRMLTGPSDISSPNESRIETALRAALLSDTPAGTPFRFSLALSVHSHPLSLRSVHTTAGPPANGNQALKTAAVARGIAGTHWCSGVQQTARSLFEASVNTANPDTPFPHAGSNSPVCHAKMRPHGVVFSGEKELSLLQATNVALRRQIGVHNEHAWWAKCLPTYTTSNTWEAVYVMVAWILDQDDTVWPDFPLDEFVNEFHQLVQDTKQDATKIEPGRKQLQQNNWDRQINQIVDHYGVCNRAIEKGHGSWYAMAYAEPARDPSDPTTFMPCRLPPCTLQHMKEMSAQGKLEYISLQSSKRAHMVRNVSSVVADASNIYDLIHKSQYYPPVWHFGQHNPEVVYLKQKNEPKQKWNIEPDITSKSTGDHSSKTTDYGPTDYTWLVYVVVLAVAGFLVLRHVHT